MKKTTFLFVIGLLLVLTGLSLDLTPDPNMGVLRTLAPVLAASVGALFICITLFARKDFWLASVISCVFLLGAVYTLNRCLVGSTTIPLHCQKEDDDIEMSRRWLQKIAANNKHLRHPVVAPHPPLQLEHAKMEFASTQHH